MTASPYLNKRLIDLGFVVIGGVLVWKITQTLSSKLNETAKEVTKPVGELISDLSSYMNGWEAVELTPLLIRDVYLSNDFKLKPEAEATLWKIEQYKPLLREIFGTQGGAMASKYKPLINIPIKE